MALCQTTLGRCTCTATRTVPMFMGSVLLCDTHAMPFIDLEDDQEELLVSIPQAGTYVHVTGGHLAGKSAVVDHVQADTASVTYAYTDEAGRLIMGSAVLPLVHLASC